MQRSQLSCSPFIQVANLSDEHADPINCLSFSHDGCLLASGGDDGKLVVWDPAERKPKCRVIFENSVDILLWHPIYPGSLIVGLSNGDLQQLSGFGSLRDYEQVEIRLGGKQAIHCVAYDDTTRCLAVGMGSRVYVTRECQRNVYAGIITLPEPLSPEVLQGPDRVHLNAKKVVAIDVSFHKDGKNLIVSYVSHGIVCWDTSTHGRLWEISLPVATPTIAGAVLFAPVRLLAVYNSVSGVDMYDIAYHGKQRPRKTYPLDERPHSKHRLPVQFINYGAQLFCGTTNGNVRIWDVASANVFQDLHHDSASPTRLYTAVVKQNKSYIATGSIGSGGRPQIKVWAANLGERLCASARFNIH
ncbi:WD40-repeat-containing domain protein [Epithele typhae]|uniref:WD40-repeat-containing domain protein n=1 Tax=Epithele typhae TaxID=378194 RepID=UPI002008E042|nr:WD40-repeat-containing domain protein [Epithele typhae]KAH9911735.1 WD40-repeat-containing domain protein [Epithele typhae]